MRVAYLILADGAARHMGRLLRALSSPFVFVHVDRRVPIEPFRAVAAPHIEFAEDRIAVNPQDWSRVDAILGLMREAFAMRQDWDRLVLLSSTQRSSHGLGVRLNSA
jgi:hypothetical protein